MMPFIILMLFIPTVALVLLAGMGGDFSKRIAVASTLIGVLLVLAVLVQSLAAHSVNVSESYSYINALGITLSFSINVWSLALLLMSSVVLLAAALSGNPEGERPKLSSALVVLFQIAAFGLFSSANLFLFFIFWDMGVIAMFFMINVLGSANRKSASMNFLLYEIFASALLLLGIVLIYCYTPSHSLDIPSLVVNAGQMPKFVQEMVFLLLFAAFMTNMPMFPMHFWLPDAHTEASTQGSMLLSGILTKFGGFGMLLLFINLPVASAYAPYVAAIAAISAFYAVLVLMKQTDIKRVAAYSTIVEMSIIMIGISSLTELGEYGSLYAMLAHGLSIALMFLAIGSIKYMFGERDIRVLRGTVMNARFTTYAFLLCAVATIGCPLTPAFVADILIFLGAMQTFGLYGLVPLLALILVGAYLYYVISRSMLSTKEHSSLVNFIGLDQHAGYMLLALFMLLFGAMPFILFRLVGL
jgi:NADH-quinone oxidoreductase subunit M